jgi:putative transposase
MDQYEARGQAQTALFTYTNGFYNPRRRHSYMGSISPVKFERMAG